MKLLQFFADLSRDPRLQEEFTRDPRQTMRRYQLEDADQALFLGRDREALGEAIAEEVRRKLPQLRPAVPEPGTPPPVIGRPGT